MISTLHLMTMILSTMHRASGFTSFLRRQPALTFHYHSRHNTHHLNHFAKGFRQLMRLPFPRQTVRLQTSAVERSCELQLYVPAVDDMEDLGGLLATLVLDPPSSQPSEKDKKGDQADLILLDGDLGAGKTALSRGFIQTALGDFDLQVTSPTYLLSNSYRTLDGPNIHHMDLYRLTGTTTSELRPLNLQYVFENCVALMEWPERLGDLRNQLPAERLEIAMSITASPQDGEEEDREAFDSNQLRKAVLTAYGERWKARLETAVGDGFLEDMLEPPLEA